MVMFCDQLLIAKRSHVSLKHLIIFSKNTVLLLLLVSLSACATVRKPLTGLVPGRQVETLQSPIAITVKSGEHSTGGRGYLIFKQPDRFHMAMLSPFGLTVLEVFSDSDRLTCLIPSRQTAYSGLLSELPDNSALKSLGAMKWVVAPPAAAPPSGTREVTAASGDRFFFDTNGLVQRKVSLQGDEVVYDDYRSVNGVAFPDSIVIGSRYGAEVKITFDEPQINLPVEDSALIPVLEGISVLPLADFKGF